VRTTNESAMRKVLSLSVVMVGISLSGARAFAQDTEEPPDTRPAAVAPYGGLELGLRLGVGFPAGKVGAGPGLANSNLSDTVDAIIPLAIDAGYRFNDTFYLGLSGQFGFGFVNTDSNAICTQGADCSASVSRIGLNLHLHLAPGQSFDPWLGLGVGYEWLDVSASSEYASGSLTTSGFDFADLQLGGDIAATPNCALGPFLSVSLGEYRNLSTSGASSTDQALVSKNLHAWIAFGMRFVFDSR
jgi:opacity protein-like surface antigen